MFKMGLMRVFSSLIPAIVLAIAMERKKKKGAFTITYSVKFIHLVASVNKYRDK